MIFVRRAVPQVLAVSCLFSAVTSASGKLRKGKASSAEGEEHRDLGFFDFLPDFELPGRGDIADTIGDVVGDTLCNNGVGAACDNEINGDGPECTILSPLGAEVFDVEQYINGTWYVQKQQEWPLLGKKQMNCVLHTYMWRDPVAAASGRVGASYLNAYQYANDKEPGGTVLSLEMYTAWAGICMKQASGGDFNIANCAVADLEGVNMGDFSNVLNPFIGATSGPYWVLATGPNYEWAIASGGQPNEIRKTKKVKDPNTGEKQEVNYCSTLEGDSVLDIYDGAGLFLMTREPFAPAAVQEMELWLQARNVWTEDLLTVEHEGCDYYGATIIEYSPDNGVMPMGRNESSPEDTITQLSRNGP